MRTTVDITTIDMCNRCIDKFIKGNMIFAHSAQGYNAYYFKDEASE